MSDETSAAAEPAKRARKGRNPFNQCSHDEATLVHRAIACLIGARDRERIGRGTADAEVMLEQAAARIVETR